MNDGRLHDKVVIVFGGAQGIGRGCALAMASDGATVVVADLKSDGADAVAQEVAERGAPGFGFECDVSDEPQVRGTVERAVNEFGHLDGIVNLAYAGTRNGPLAAMKVENLRRELEVTVVGMFTTMTAAFPYLRERGGSIVNFSSGAAIEGTVGLAAYAAAKSAVRGLSLSAANEWGSDQVRVNVVCPVAMAPSVPLFFKNRPGDYEASLAKIPLGRYGDPETDIGGAVAFLVSDDAQYITGQTIMIDGGQVHL